jgi:hypothetical protein
VSSGGVAKVAAPAPTMQGKACDRSDPTCEACQ